MEQKRIDWLDTLKFLGIFAIYLGHRAETAGYSFAFVFTYHLPLFFFCSGCAEAIRPKRAFLEELKHSFVALVLPFFVFAVGSIFIYALLNNIDLVALIHQFYYVATGAVRSQFVAYTLWFLTCLFVMRSLFSLIRRVNRLWLMLLIGIVLYAITSYAFPETPDDVPKWFWNVDSALYFMIYYVIGYAVFPRLITFLQTRLLKPVGLCITLLALVFAAFVFFDQNPLNVLLQNIALRPLALLITALLLIFLNAVIAYALRHVTPLCTVGRSTLYLCGNEYIARVLVEALLGMFGLHIQVETPLTAYLYTAMLLTFAYFVLMPAEKPIVQALQGFAIKRLRIAK